MHSTLTKRLLACIAMNLLIACKSDKAPHPDTTGKDTTVDMHHDKLQIIDISQKQLALYDQYKDADSVQRVNLFRDSLFYPYQDVWQGYLGTIETFDAVAEHYGVRIIDSLREKNKLFYAENNAESLLQSFFTVREGMKQLTGYTPKGKWYLLYGPAIANLGGVGDGVMFIDFAFPGNKDLPSVINWFPHELNHQIHANQNKDTLNTALNLCLDEGFAAYVNKRYWNTIGGKAAYSEAMTLDYTEQELAAAQREWDFILSYFKEHYRSADGEIRLQFGSRSAKLKDDLPGAIGYLIGYRIVEAYVQAHGPDSWKDIYTMPAEEVLDRSGFLTP